jgi:hypothetical protein
VVVAVAFVDVVAMAVDHVVDVTVVLHGGVTAARTVDVLRIVTFANMGDAGLGAHAYSYGPG